MHETAAVCSLCLMDGSERLLETALVNLDTPYIKQSQVVAMCVENPEYDIVVGNIQGARCRCNPNPKWKLEACKTERS